MTADVAVIAASSAVMFLYGPAFYAVARLRKRRDRRQSAPVPQAAVAQARADIAAEAEHFDLWEQEVSA